MNHAFRFYPLAGAGIGAGVRQNKGKTQFITSLFRQDVHITYIDQTFASHAEGAFGESSFSNTKRHWDFNIEGGLRKGMTKVTAAFDSTYATSKSKRESTMTYYYAKAVGMEKIDFDGVTMRQLMAALKPNVRKSLKKCMDAYQKLMAASDIQYNKAHYQKHQKDIATWRQSVDEFYQHYGEECVVGVLWGAIGQVETKMTFKDENKIKDFAVKGQVEVNGLAAGVNVKSAFGWGKDESTAEVQFSAKGYAYGSACEPIVNKWMESIYKNGADKLGEVNVQEHAQARPLNMDVPAHPKLDPPPGIADRFGKIGSLAQAKALVKLQGYDRWVNEPGNQGKSIEEYEATLVENTEPQNSNTAPENGAPEASATPTADDPSGGSNDLAGKFVPLGVYLTNWADLFPCLSIRVLQNLTKDQETALKDNLRKAEVLQALNTLKRLYAFWLRAKGPDLPKLKDGDLPFLINDLSAAIEKIVQGEQPDAVIGSLSEPASHIYAAWQKCPDFKEAELGFACIESSNRLLTKYDFRNNNYTGNITYSRPFNGNNHGPCFADVVKFFPIIDSDQKVYFFSEYTGNDGLRTGKKYPSFLRIVTSAQYPNTLPEFKYSKDESFNHNNFPNDPGRKLLISSGQYYVGSTKNYNYHMIPIPLSAVQGIRNWQGSVMTRDEAGNSRDELDRIAKELKVKNQWIQELGVATDHLFYFEEKEKQWNAGYYGGSLFNKSQYMGILSRPTSI